MYEGYECTHTRNEWGKAPRNFLGQNFFYWTENVTCIVNVPCIISSYISVSVLYVWLCGACTRTHNCLDTYLPHVA